MSSAAGFLRILPMKPELRARLNSVREANAAKGRAAASRRDRKTLTQEVTALHPLQPKTAVWESQYGPHISEVRWQTFWANVKKAVTAVTAVTQFRKDRHKVGRKANLGSSPVATDPEVLRQTAVVEWLEAHPDPSFEPVCKHCGRTELLGAPLLPFGGPKPRHTLLHKECWPDWMAHRERQAKAAIDGNATTVGSHREASSSDTGSDPEAVDEFILAWLVAAYRACPIPWPEKPSKAYTDDHDAAHMLEAYKKYVGVEKADEGAVPPAFQTAWRRQRFRWSSDIWLQASNKELGRSKSVMETQIPARRQGSGGALTRPHALPSAQASALQGAQSGGVERAG